MSIRSKLSSASFVKKFSKSAKDFTRTRKLSFCKIVLIILRKSAKSTQLVLNELSAIFEDNDTATAGAYTRARSKLRYEAFIELSQECIVQPFYKSNDYKRYQGLRLLAVDSSLIRLPMSESTEKRFGTVGIHDPKGQRTEFVQGRCSVLYDIENDICLDGVLESRKKFDRELAKTHFSFLRESDNHFFF